MRRSRPGQLCAGHDRPPVRTAPALPRAGSIKVKPGQRVVAGQLLGLCGNSGNSSEPHLHVHFQDDARLAIARGVEPRLSGVVLARDGKTETVDDYTFERGDVIRPAK